MLCNWRALDMSSLRHIIHLTIEISNAAFFEIWNTALWIHTEMWHLKEKEHNEESLGLSVTHKLTNVQVHITKVPLWAHCNDMNRPGCPAGFSIMLRTLDLCIVNVHCCRNCDCFSPIFILGYDTNLKWLEMSKLYFLISLALYIAALCRMQRTNGGWSGGCWIAYLCWFSL